MSAKRVEPAEARALQDQGWTYIDVRTVEEFEAGHPAGSINVPINSPDFLAVMQARFDPDSPLIVGCQLGGRSARACVLLENSGFLKLVDQTGGWGGQRDGKGRVLVPGWEDAKLPTGGGVRYADFIKDLTPI